MNYVIVHESSCLLVMYVLVLVLKCLLIFLDVLMFNMFWGLSCFSCVDYGMN